MNALDKSPIRLLLVDDDQVDRLACKRALAQYPDYAFEVLEAETGQQGLDLARTGQPDCILLDYHLPDFNGVEFLAELAEDTGELPVPVVMLTGVDNAVVAVDALKLGARDYLVKDAEQESMQWLPAVILRALREQRAIREKIEAVAQLREAEAKYRTLVEQIPAITYIASLEAPGKLHYISPQIQQFGLPTGEWLDDPQGLLKQVHPEDRLRVIEEFARTYELHAPLRCEYRMVTGDGRARWFLDEANVVRDDAGRPLFLQGILVDITEDKEVEQELEHYRRRLEELVAQRTAQLERQTDLLKAANVNMSNELCERKQAEAALQASEARFRLLLESAGEGIYGVDVEGCCIFINQAALNMLGYTSEELLGQDTLSKIHHIDGDGTNHPAEERPIHEACRKAVCVRSTGTLWRKNGSSFLAEYSSHPMQTKGQITGAVIVFHDVTEAQAQAQRLSFQASHDPLTGLINRAEFEPRVERALASARKDQSEHAICYLDLDQFKVVNDTCGHAAGDELLRCLANLLHSRLRQRDTLARLGGDEFGLLLEHCSIDQAWHITNELCEAARDFRFIWEGKTFSVGVSIGVAALTATSRDISSVLSAADAACYLAKEKGRSRVHIFRSDDIEIIERHPHLGCIYIRNGN